MKISEYGSLLATAVIVVSVGSIAAADGPKDVVCMSVDAAAAANISVADLREEYRAAYRVGTDDCVFPGNESEVAGAWSDLQDRLYTELRTAGLSGLGGSSFTSVVLFEPGGRISHYFFSGLDDEVASTFCSVVRDLAAEYRFPLTAETRFSQCGTTHFGAEQRLREPSAPGS